MRDSQLGVRVGGKWLAVASVLLAGVLVFHGSLAPNPEEQMRVIAASATRWGVVHCVAAVALSLFAVAGLVVLTARSRLTSNGWTMSAWAGLPVGALWTTTTAVAEVTVIAGAAAAGDAATFDAWWAFAEGRAAGFTALALAVAVIAANEAQTLHAATPAWASWAAVGAAVGSFVGWALGIWLGIGMGNLLWVAASFVMCLWTCWFGVGLRARPTSTDGER